MNNFSSVTIGALALSLAANSLSAQAPAVAAPPVAAREAHETAIHGYKLNDDYFWLRKKTEPAVRAYLEAENAYTAAIMKDTEPLQQKIYDEIVGHIKQTDLSVPYRRGRAKESK